LGCHSIAILPPQSALGLATAYRSANSAIFQYPSVGEGDWQITAEFRLHCPICASERWMQENAPAEAQNVQPVLTATTTNMGLLAMPVNHFVCRNCGYSLHFMPVQNVTLSIENG
jgi:hypothetical protein